MLVRVVMTFPPRTQVVNEYDATLTLVMYGALRSQTRVWMTYLVR